MEYGKGNWTNTAGTNWNVCFVTGTLEHVLDTGATGYTTSQKSILPVRSLQSVEEALLIQKKYTNICKITTMKKCSEGALHGALKVNKSDLT